MQSIAHRIEFARRVTTSCPLGQAAAHDTPLPPWTVEEQSACFVVFLLDPLMNVDPLHKK